MAQQNHSQPRWWPLYALGLIMLGALFLAHNLTPSPGWRTFLDIGLVGVGFGLMAWWLETHPNALLDRPAIEIHRRAIEAVQLELPALLSPPVRVHFYVYSNLPITYSIPEHSTNNLPLNDYHHPAKNIPSLPEEVVKPLTNNGADKGKSFFRHLIPGIY